MQIFSINSEATREIFRQLKLRGIGGIIIIAVLIDGLRNGAPKWLFDRIR